jgi:pimeloyl-ACP methyl ester carboxylesterase
VFFAPLPLLFAWLVGLLSLALLVGGAYLVWAWYVGVVVGTAWLVGGLAMLLWTFVGRWVVLLFRRRGRAEPGSVSPESIVRLERPDGTVLSVATYGPPDAPALVLTHGAGTDATSWYYAQKHLADRFRLIAWDLPGLGDSSRAGGGDYSLERHARDLAAVLDATVRGPAMLVGHSLGGMIALTFCRLFPERLGQQVAGLVLVGSTPTNPVETSTASGFLRVIQKPVLEPLLHVTAWLAPLVWLMSWLSYLNGTAHLLAMVFGFAGSESRGQLDRATAYNPRAWPGVQAREMLAMLRYDAGPTLAALNVPVLCMTGHLDRLVVPETSHLMASRIPGGQVKRLTPAGHMSVFEAHTELVLALEAFCGKALASARAITRPPLRRAG